MNYGQRQLFLSASAESAAKLIKKSLPLKKMKLLILSHLRLHNEIPPGESLFTRGNLVNLSYEQF